MSENLIVPEKIRMFHVDIVEKNINEIGVVDELDIEFSVMHNTMHNLDDERVKIELYIEIISKKEAGIKFHIDFHYQIQDLKDHYEINDLNKVIFSGQFIGTLIGISFSTARGIILQELQETKFKGLILPIVSPMKILEANNKEKTNE